MNRTFVVARRVLTQLLHDRRLFGLSVLAPLLIIYFFKIFFDTMPTGFNVARYVVPIAAFMVHFLAFLLCAIVLVQERSAGTLERMFVNGFRRIEIISGYVLGYMFLATLQAVVAVVEVLLLFNLDYSWGTIVILLAVIWLLAIASVMLGMFVSTFARHEGQVFPFIPLLILPSVFLSGLIVNNDLLPTWAAWIGRALPLYYANTVIQEVIKPQGGDVGSVWWSFVVLALYAIGLLGVASRTLREVE